MWSKLQAETFKILSFAKNARWSRVWQKSIWSDGCVGWWVEDSFRKYCHFMAPSCKLELARFSALLKIQDGAECGNKASLLFMDEFKFM